MQSQILATRAICSVYILEVVRPVFISLIVGCLAFVGVTIYLAVAYTAWWLIFLLPLSVTFTILIVVATVVFSIARAVGPDMNAAQKQAAQAYVRHIHQVSDELQTPKIVIIIKVLIDLLRRRWQGGFIQHTTANSVRLKKDFAALTALF